MKLGLVILAALFLGCRSDPSQWRWVTCQVDTTQVMRMHDGDWVAVTCENGSRTWIPLEVARALVKRRQ